MVVAGWLAEGGLSRQPTAARAWLFGVIDAGNNLVGVVYVSETGVIIPVLPEEVGTEALIEFGRRHPQLIRVMVGERWLVDRVWRRWSRIGFRTRLVRDQKAYAVAPSAYRTVKEPLDLQLASLSDLDAIVECSAAMAREEAHDDPQARNPSLFRARIRERLLRGRDFVFLDGPSLAFKTNVSALSSVGGQIEGIYTTPAYRRRGLGRAGTAAITSWILARAPLASLLVNDDNHAARRMYERLGYRAVYDSRTTFAA